MKRLKWFALGFVVVVVATVTVVVLRLDAIVRYAIETQSTASLGLATQLESAHVSILGGSLTLTDFQVSSPQGFDAPRMFTLGGASVGVSVGKLRGDPIGIDQVVIDKPRLVIEQHNGKFNFQALTELASNKPADDSEPIRLIIQDLAVNNAEVVIRPGVPGLQQEIAVPIPSFHVRQIGTGEGAQNGAAIKEVVLLVITDLARQAAKSDRLPEDVRRLLNVNVDQINQEIEGKVQQQIDKVKEKIGDEAGKAIEKGIGDLLGGKSDQKKQK